MQEQALILNILNFNHAQKPISCSFFKEQQSGFSCLSLHEAPIELKEQTQNNSELNHLYTNFTISDNADFHAEIDLTRSVRFAKHYYSHLIRQYFKDKVDIVNPNFINDIQVWIHEVEKSTELYKAYRVFGIRVQMANITNKPELVIYHNGISRILNNSINDLWEFSKETFSRVLYKGELYHMDDLPEEAEYNHQEVYPIVNKDLEIHYKISNSTNPFANRYKDLLPRLNNFILKYFDNDEFKQLINLKSTDLIDVPNRCIHSTRLESNFIQLGLENKVQVFTPKENLKEHGPYKLPENTNVKFIVIYHKDDKDHANQLFMYMKKLYKKPNGQMMTDLYGTSLYDYIRIGFDLDKEHSIAFEDKSNPYEAVHNFIDNTDIDIEKHQYVAIYISPYNKDEEDTEKKKIYYKVKETLLKHHITSQAIYRERIFEKKFKSYYYANIAAAILAKVGGIPWRLDSPVKNELVVGVGAFKSQEFGIQYIGSAFSFSNNGEFQEFSCTSKGDSFLLGAKIKIYIQEYLKKNTNIERLVIHFYKAMSKEEIKPIKDALFNLGYKDIPIYIININKTTAKDYIAFDTNFEGLIPYSGTILDIGKNQYLLFNNTRYRNAGADDIESYHFPIKLGFQCTQPELLNNKLAIKDMIDQIYQFSRMYWKSVKQQNLPVTVKYPEMVAKMYPYFESEDIPEFGKTNMWFL